MGASFGSTAATTKKENVVIFYRARAIESLVSVLLLKYGSRFQESAGVVYLPYDSTTDIPDPLVRDKVVYFLGIAPTATVLRHVQFLRAQQVVVVTHEPLTSTGKMQIVPGVVYDYVTHGTVLSQVYHTYVRPYVLEKEKEQLKEKEPAVVSPAAATASDTKQTELLEKIRAVALPPPTPPVVSVDQKSAAPTVVMTEESVAVTVDWVKLGISSTLPQGALPWWLSAIESSVRGSQSKNVYPSEMTAYFNQLTQFPVTSGPDFDRHLIEVLSRTKEVFMSTISEFHQKRDEALRALVENKSEKKDYVVNTITKTTIPVAYVHCDNPEWTTEIATRLERKFPDAQVLVVRQKIPACTHLQMVLLSPSALKGQTNMLDLAQKSASRFPNCVAMGVPGHAMYSLPDYTPNAALAQYL